MNNQAFLDRIEPIFRELFEDYKGPISAELDAAKVPGWDSLAHVQLIVFVEREFSVKLSAAEVSKVANLGELGELIGRKLR